MNRPHCVEETLDEFAIEREAKELLESLSYWDDDTPLITECRLCGSVFHQTHTVNSDIDIIVADIPGPIAAAKLAARGYVYIQYTGGDGFLPVRFMYYNRALDLSVDLLWFGGTLNPPPLAGKRGGGGFIVTVQINNNLPEDQRIRELGRRDLDVDF